MGLVAAAVVLFAAGPSGAAGRAAPGRTGASAAAGAARLVPFRSCGDLLGYVKAQAAPLVGPWGLGGSSAPGVMPPGVAVPAAGATPVGAGPTEGVDYSGTNVQEQGVDEPDLVKTNGTTLFAVAGNRLNAVDVTGTRPRLLDSLTLDSGWSHELLLAGDRLLVLSRGGYWVTPLPAAAAIPLPYFPAHSVLSEIDVSNPKALRLVRTLTLDGAYVDARLVGTAARIVVSSQVPSVLPFERPTDSTPAALAAAREQNRAVLQASGLGAWLPTYQIKRAGRPAQAARPLVQCRNVDRPQKFSGLGMLTVLTVNLAYLRPIGDDLLLGIGQDVNDQGQPVGTQLSLFDVSDLRHPSRLAHATLGAGWSEAESDPHAFLFWPQTDLVVVPFDQRAVGYRVGRSTGLELVGRITHPKEQGASSAIARSVVVGNSVFTVSPAGVASSSLATLAPQGWVSFPPPAQVPGPVPLPSPGP
jgi:uncharacterized secreted protein with C-terminal beta-propeller domain